jgi:hypothetical protein
MNILRKAITTLGGVFLAALLITALAPKAARGVAAALVQVTNTSTNPVPTVSADANFPYEAFLCIGNCGTAPTSFSVPSTTATGVSVKRLVIEDLNTFCSAGSEILQLEVPAPADTNQPGVPIAYLFLETDAAFGGSIGHAIVRIYADPLATVSFNGSSGTCSANVTGYLETK